MFWQVYYKERCINHHMETHRAQSPDRHRNQEQQSTNRAHERRSESLESLRRYHTRFGRPLPRSASENDLNSSHPHPETSGQIGEGQRRLSRSASDSAFNSSHLHLMDASEREQPPHQDHPRPYAQEGQPLASGLRRLREPSKQHMRPDSDSEGASLGNSVDSLSITPTGIEVSDDSTIVKNQELRIRENWEDTFQQWSKPLSGEKQKSCGRAEHAIRQTLYKDRVLLNMLETLQGNGQREIAREKNTITPSAGEGTSQIEMSTPAHQSSVESRAEVSSLLNDQHSQVMLPQRNIKNILQIYPQSSYRCGTNIESSDIDLNVSYNWDLLAKGSPGFADSQKFKGLVGEALVRRFNEKNVKITNFAFKLNEILFNVNIDIIASFAYKRDIERQKNNLVKTRQTTEIGFYRDKSTYIVERAEEGFRNKAIKHQQTGRRFKKSVRILKKLQERMQESNAKAFRNAPGQIIEALVYNVPNSVFGHKYITDDIMHILNYCIQNTSDDEKCKSWMDADKFRPVFDKNRKWMREQAHHFFVAAREYIGSKLPTQETPDSGSDQQQTDREKNTITLPTGKGTSQIEMSTSTHQPSVDHYQREIAGSGRQLGPASGC